MTRATMTAGEPFEIEFRFKEDQETAKDLTGYDAKIELRDASPTGEILEAFDDQSAEITRDDAGGVVTLTISPAKTGTYTFQTAYLDLLVATADDGLRSGSVAVSLNRGVTR